MRKVAAAGPFISRGDGSGTEKKELELWKAAGVEPATVHRREETGQGMGATLLVASERRGYTLTDRGTYLALRERARPGSPGGRRPQAAQRLPRVCRQSGASIGR